MGIFKRRRKKTIEENEEQIEEYQDLSDIVTPQVKDKVQGEDFDECVELFIRSTLKLDDLKVEYEQVTAYLTDIQLIDQALPEEQQQLAALAEEIVKISDNREYLKENAQKLSDLQFKFMQLHEEEIPETIKRMQEEEAYGSKVQEDLRQIRETKKDIKLELSVLKQKMYGRRLFMYSTLFVGILYACLLAFLNMYYIFEIGLWYMIGCVVFGGTCTWLFLNYRKLNQQFLNEQKKQERAVQLENKVKIKYVNNTNAIDFMCTKYNVGSSRELLYLWKQYTNIIEEEKFYRQSSSDLNYYGEALLKILRTFGLHDVDVWLYQAEALIDSKEMVEVTHNLNQRRQDLREKIKDQEDIGELNLNLIRTYIAADNSLLEEINEKLRPYHMHI